MQLSHRQTGLLLSLGITLLLAGCDEPPTCRAREPAQVYPAANAGCLITDGVRMVAVQERLRGLWNLPGGTSSTESAACTAHRETWEETGLDVQVVALLQRYRNGFHLFRCEVDVPDRAVLAQSTAPFWWEIDRIDAVPLTEAHLLSWRYPTQMNALLSQTKAPPGHLPVSPH